MKPSPNKDKIMKQYLMSRDVDEALKVCVKKRSHRTEREFIERLIMEEFERLQRGQTGPESAQIVDRLDYIKALLIPILEHIYITRQLSFFSAKILKTLPDQVKKIPEEQVAEFFKTAMEKAMINLKNEVGY